MLFSQVASATFGVDRNRTSQYSGGARAQRRSNAVITELPRLAGSGSAADSSVRSLYEFKGDKRTHFQPPTPVVVVPLVVKSSPSIDCRELLESPRNQITPLEVSLAARDSRFSSNATLSGQQELSSSVTHAQSIADSSARSQYQFKGDKQAHFQPRSSPVVVPLVVKSPSIDRRGLPEFPRSQITPLEVSLAARDSRFSSNATPPGKQESFSSITHAESIADSSASSPYQFKGDKRGHFQLPSPPVVVPLVVKSPSIGRRGLPESPRNQITPLEVSDAARHSRFNSNVTLSDKRESSSSIIHAESTADSSARSPYQFKDDKGAHFQPPSPPVVVPLVVKSPYIDRREHPESPHNQITPLEVSLAARDSRFNSNATLSGKQVSFSFITHAESTADSSAGSQYQSKGEKRTQLQPHCPPVVVPLVLKSPSIDRRGLTESPRSQIMPLEVNSTARRSRFNSNATLSGKRESSSSTTHAISSTLEAAAVVAAVASSDDGSQVVSSSRLMLDTNEDNRATTRNSGYTYAAGTKIVREKSKDECFLDTTLVVTLSHESRFLMLPFRQTVRATVGARARPGTQAQPERVELDERVLEKTQLDVAAEDSWALESKGHGRPSSFVGPQLSGPRPHTAQYMADPGARRRGYVSTQGAHVHEIEKSDIQSSHGDMIQIQPSKTDDIFNDASLSRSTSRQSR